MTNVKFGLLLLISLPSLLIAKEVSKKSKPLSQPLSASMQTLQKTLTELGPYLFSTKQFVDPTKQTFLKEKFSKLALEAQHLDHSPILKDQDPTVRFVAAHFAEDLDRAAIAFKEDKKEFARYQVIKVMSSCMQCHTRMTKGPAINFKKTEEFFSMMQPSEQAEYLIASRRFDQAFQVLLKGLEKPQQLSAWEADKVAGLAMILAVQYDQDIAKAEKVINLIEGTEAPPLFLSLKIKKWKNSLALWKKQTHKPVNLAELKGLLEKNESEVEAMRIIPEVLKLIDQTKTSTEKAEALLLAGESYEVLNQVTSNRLHENYYESCIRTAPHTSVSKTCFKKLFESVKMGYTGSMGTNIPSDIDVWLRELKTLTF